MSSEIQQWRDQYSVPRHFFYKIDQETDDISFPFPEPITGDGLRPMENLCKCISNLIPMYVNHEFADL